MIIDDNIVSNLKGYFNSEVDIPIRTIDSLNWNIPDSDKTKCAVNIVGPNGSGKSVLPSLFNFLDDKKYWVVNDKGDKILTVYPSLGWASVGIYRTKCGGCDSLVKDMIMEAVYRLSLTNLNFLLEGSIVSNTKYTYWDIFRGINEKFQGIQPRKTMFILMDYPNQVYFDRVYQRNGGKEINIECLSKKIDAIRSYFQFYIDNAEEDGINVFVEKSEGLTNVINSVIHSIESVLGVDIFK